MAHCAHMSSCAIRGISWVSRDLWLLLRSPPPNSFLQDDARSLSQAQLLLHYRGTFSEVH